MKKILLLSGILVSVAPPVAIIISCNKKNVTPIHTDPTNTNPTNTNPTNTNPTNTKPTNTNPTNTKPTIVLKSKEAGDEQLIVNDLLSMGAKVNPASLPQATKVVLDDKAIDKYGIRMKDGSKYTFKSKFKYEYTATSSNIKIYVSKDSKVSTEPTSQILISRNSFEGKFTSLKLEKEFLAITNIVKESVFGEELGLTSISLPDVETIKTKAFENIELTQVSLPKVKVIEEIAFSSALLTSLSLPEAETIGMAAFTRAPLTSLSLPKVTSIGNYAFAEIEDKSSTTIVLSNNIDTSDPNSKMFGDIDLTKTSMTITKK